MTLQPIELRSKDGLKLHGCRWHADHDPSRVVCIVHGHGEHIGRYEPMAQFLVENGMEVYGMDLRGHGQSEGKKGHAPRYELLLADIEEMIKQARLDHLEKPLVLFGHSLGGGIAANFVINRKAKELNAAIISSPWLELAFQPARSQVNLARFMLNIWPGFTQSTKLDASLLSHDQAVVEAYQNDPLVHDLISPALFLGVIKAGEEALEKAHEVNCRMLVWHGDEDKITSHEASEMFAKGANAQFKLWSGMMHECHNEVDKKEVYDLMLDWIKKG